MFLGISLSVVNVILNVFQLILVLAVGRMLVIYSKYGGKYASSVRWIHQGGPLDTIIALYYGYRVPGSAKLMILSALILATIAGFSTAIISYLIHPSQSLSNVSEFRMVAEPYMSVGEPPMIESWRSYVRVGDNVADAINLLMNSTDNLVNSTSNFQYMRDKGIFTVHSTDYNVICSKLDIHILGEDLLANDCMDLIINPTLPWQISTSSNTIDHRSDGTLNLTLYYRHSSFTEVSPWLLLMSNYTACGAVDDEVAGMISNSKPGPSSLPTTLVTKCQSKNGDLMVVSNTVTRFNTDVELLNSSISLLFGRNEVLSKVESSFRNSNYIVNDTQNIAFLEARVEGTSVEIGYCASEYQDTTDLTAKSIACYYSYLKVLLIYGNGPAEIEEKHQQVFGSGYVTIKHKPDNQNTTLATRLDVKRVTDELADLFARQSTSLIVHWESRKATILFDYQEIIKGIEVPNWLVAVSCLLLLIALVVIGWTFTFDDVYFDSFYSTLTKRILYNNDNHKSSIAKAEFNDGIRLNSKKVRAEVPLLSSSSSEGIPLNPIVEHPRK